MAFTDVPPYASPGFVMRSRIAFAVRVLLAWGAGGCALGCASGDRAGEAYSSASAEIVGGESDSVDSNVFLVASQRGHEGVALCTASLIAPNLLLTARHCVSDVTDDHVTCGKTMASTPLPASTLLALNPQSLEDAKQVYRAALVNVPAEDSDICGYDLALITLTTNVPASVAAPLVPRIERPVVLGELYRAIGYGLDAAGAEGVAGLRRARSGLAVSCVPGKCGKGVESTEFVGELGICSGDSGGPALDEAGRVVGVVSRSGADCAHPVYGSVASWKAWLVQVAQQAAERGNYVAPFWVTTGQSDPAGGSGAGAPGASATPTSGDGASAQSGKQGDPCGGAERCSSRSACYSPTNSSRDAYCAEFCSENGACPSGSTCSAEVGVCVGASSSAPATGSSCALRAPGKAAPLPGPLLALAALLLVQRKRSRASVSKRVC